MKYGIIFNTEIKEEGTFSLINLETKEVIESVGDVYIDRWETKRVKDMHDILRSLKELNCKEYILKCIEEKAIFKYKYSEHRFVVKGLDCSGQWYTDCLDYEDHRVARSTCHYEVTKLPSEIGTRAE